MVREGGVEPPRPFGHWNLNPARLPIPPPAHWVFATRIFTGLVCPLATCRRLARCTGWIRIRLFDLRHGRTGGGGVGQHRAPPAVGTVQALSRAQGSEGLAPARSHSCTRRKRLLAQGPQLACTDACAQRRTLVGRLIQEKSAVGASPNQKPETGRAGGAKSREPGEPGEPETGGAKSREQSMCAADPGGPPERESARRSSAPSAPHRVRCPGHLAGRPIRHGPHNRGTTVARTGNKARGRTGPRPRNPSPRTSWAQRPER